MYLEDSIRQYRPIVRGRRSKDNVRRVTLMLPLHLTLQVQTVPIPVNRRAAVEVMDC